MQCMEDFLHQLNYRLPWDFAIFFASEVAQQSKIRKSFALVVRVVVVVILIITVIVLGIPPSNHNPDP